MIDYLLLERFNSTLNNFPNYFNSVHGNDFYLKKGVVLFCDVKIFHLVVVLYYTICTFVPDNYTNYGKQD